MNPERRSARARSGYLDTPRRGSGWARDAVLVQSQEEPPSIIEEWRLGDVDAYLFEGRDIHVSLHPHNSDDAHVHGAQWLAIGYVANGAMQMIRGPHSVMIPSGHLAFWDNARSSTLHGDGTHRLLAAYIRGQALRMRREDCEGLVGRDLSAFAGAAALTGLLSKVACTGPRMIPGAAQHLGDAIIACIHATIAEARGTAMGERSEVLFAELTGFIDEHLAADHLTAETLAAQHFLSPRYVRKLFANHDTTVMAYVRLRRLQRIRDELLQPWSVDLPVSTIAARWGFKDPSVFSRAFTRQFGQGPQNFRKNAVRAHSNSRREATAYGEGPAV